MEKEEKAVHADSIRKIFYTFFNRFIMKNLYLILVLGADNGMLMLTASGTAVVVD